MKHNFKKHIIQDKKIIKQRDVVSIISRIKNAEKNNKKFSEKERDVKVMELLKKHIKEINDIVGECGDSVDFIDPAGRIIKGKRYSYKQEIRLFMKEIKKDPNYNPIFTYPRIEKLQEDNVVSKIKKVVKMINRIKAEEKNEHIKNIIFEYAESLLAQMNIILNVKRGSDKETYKYSVKAYSDINPGLIMEADEYYQNKLKNVAFLDNSLRKKLKKIKISSEDLKCIFHKVLDLYHIKDFNINIINNSELISISDYRNEIRIPNKRLYSCERVINLIAHEISTHAVSMANSRAIGFPMASIGKNAIIFKEGIAIYNEEKFGKYIFNDYRPNDKDWFIYAMKLRRKGNSFGEIYLEMKKRIFEQFIVQDVEQKEAEEEAEKESLQICRRIFRGMHDLSSNNSYYYTKDLCYFKGFIESKKMAEANLDHYLTEIRVDPYLLPYFISIKALSDDLLYLDKKNMKVIWEEIRNFIESNYSSKKF